MAESHGDDDLILIAAIYDAIIDPSRWDEVVKRIVEATKSFSGNLVLQQVGAGNLTALYNVDPVVADAYAQTYYKNDLLRTPAWSLAPGEVRVCSYTQTEWFKASAYCRVGGGALSCLRACLRPPLKLDVQFSRIQLS